MPGTGNFFGGAEGIKGDVHGLPAFFSFLPESGLL
jgi:hypothetical protein